MKIRNVKRSKQIANTAAAALDLVMKNPEDPLIAVGLLWSDDKINNHSFFLVKGDIVKLTEVLIELAKREPVYVAKFMGLLKDVIEVVETSAGKPNG